MITQSRYRWCAAAVFVGLAVSAPVAQSPTIQFLSGEAALGPIVLHEPYSAEGETTIVQTLGDGTHIQRTVSARFERDSAGRVRREQAVQGLAALNPASGVQVVITIVDPVIGVTYALDPATRTGVRTSISERVLNGPPPPPPPPPPGPAPLGAGLPPPPPPPPARPDEVALGTRQIEGVTVIGTRTTLSIPVGQIGNDQPINVTDERWESPDLKVLVLSHHHDPRTGDVEFRLQNLRRLEPPPERFKVPPDYVIANGTWSVRRQ